MSPIVILDGPNKTLTGTLADRKFREGRCSIGDEHDALSVSRFLNTQKIKHHLQTDNGKPMEDRSPFDDHGEITFMCKTLLRPGMLRQCLESLRVFYPKSPVLVADDSPKPYPEVSKAFDGVEHVCFEHDIGIGTCLNHLMTLVKTPYVVLLEDDFVFTGQTDCPAWLPWLRDGHYDILGGAVYKMRSSMRQSFVGYLVKDKQAREWSIRHLMPMPFDGGPVKVDITMNFFGARIEPLRRLGWDVDLKVCRHEDFFIRAQAMMLKVGYHPEVEIRHDHHKPDAYKAYRANRISQGWEIFKEKHDGYAFAY
jgi:hypothetical protein